MVRTLTSILRKSLLPLFILLILASPLPEYVLGHYLLLHNSERQPYGQLYDMTGYLEQARLASESARKVSRELDQLRRGIHSPDELYDFLQHENRVRLPKAQFLRLLRWLPRDHINELIPQEQLLELIYFSDWNEVECRRGGARVVFDFRNREQGSLYYIEMPEDWLQPSWDGLELVSRVRSLDMIDSFSSMLPQEFLLKLDSLTTTLNWQIDPGFMIDLAGSLQKVVLTSPDELLLVTQPDSLYEIWRYQVPRRSFTPFWWRP